MTIKVAVQHRTTYTFAEPVKVHPHEVRLRPAPHSRTPISSYSLTVEPAGHFVNWQQDPFGNFLARLVFPEPVKELDITVDLVADLTVINPFDFFVEEYAETFPFTYAEPLRKDLLPYLRAVGEGDGAEPGPMVLDWLRSHGLDDVQPTRIVDFLVSVNQLIRDSVAYSVRMEPGVQTPDETLSRAIGSCRDSAWLLVAVLRRLGLAARFVSGYLVQLVTDDVLGGEAELEGPAGPSADFTDLHAWAEVFVPGAGWIGLDATSGLFAGEGHIPLSATPDPATSAPITGATDWVDVSFSFSNVVTRVHEDARVTYPYSDDQWEAIDALGDRVDALLAEGDVRLSMGGEPTFVSVDDSSTPEWNTAADGPAKRLLARDLTERLRDRWAPNGIVQHPQGKWYPGEPLPRWQSTLVWRADGEPIWTDPKLLDHPWADAPDLEADAPREFARMLGAFLGIPDKHVLPAFEDPYATRWADARLPYGEPEGDDIPDIDTVDGAAADPVAWVVPVFERPDGPGWSTTQWRFRRGRLFLLGGTSPAGLRLPLDSIDWVAPPDHIDASPFEDRPRLGTVTPTDEPARIVPVAGAPRYAVVIEEREGHLFAFLPPISDVDHALGLIAVLEKTAKWVDVPIVIEGYPIPGDARTRSLSVTPDPGVIEVNVQPTSSWGEFRDLTTSLYADARATRLTTEKFDLDGTHTGTGGGNHFTLGGLTPADSPLLRRPALLTSLLTYWQHHPALSYLFSGRFIGPTSQAPRVDEGRTETLYELEIAFAELARVASEDPEGHTAPWIVDRALRHLLTDLTGNTHRAEFCIDKLYSPDSDRGRLGLLELRGFEMPPHARMALVQGLLVRTLVARFWDEPYAGPLVRWGTRLHDRFLLPHFARADLAEVIEDVNRWLVRRDPDATTFDLAWFDPFLEFRFPRIGEADFSGVHIEMRTAIEPWAVLGEEVGLSGTARYVDSSVERMQLKVSGLVEGRQILAVNGVPLPLTATGVPGEFVAGVRYRAWAPYSALHPTIGIHSPLVVDVVDVGTSCSIGGLTYHVVHPGGRAYDDRPVNAMSAEARRAGRFHAGGHTPGPIDLIADAPWQGGTDRLAGTEYPTTLDLRRFSPGRGR